jgi:hypothetical protein
MANEDVLDGMAGLVISSFHLVGGRLESLVSASGSCVRCVRAGHGENDSADARRLTRRMAAGELILSFVRDAEQRTCRSRVSICQSNNFGRSIDSLGI